MKNANAFVLVLFCHLSLSFSTATADPTKSDIQANQLQAYPWSEDSQDVRVAKTLLHELSIPSVTITNFDSMLLVLTDEFNKAFNLSASEIDQVSRALTSALHDYRTIEGKHFEPADGPANIGCVRYGEPVAGMKFHFRLIPFPEEAVAVRKRLEAEVLASLGAEWARFFWDNGFMRFKGAMNSFTNDMPPGTTTTYAFELPDSHPGRVDFYRTTFSESGGRRGGGSDGHTYGEFRDQYAPEMLKPILAAWRKRAEKTALKSESPTATQASVPAQVKQGVITNSNPVNPKWDSEALFVEMPKSLIPSLKVLGLTLEDEISPEAAALFGLSVADQMAVRDLYKQMKTRFEQLERAHFERMELVKNGYVLKGFPDESAALKNEWLEKLKALVGQTRGELLDQTIRTELTAHHFTNPHTWQKLMRSLSFGNEGPNWLRRGTTMIRLQVTPETDESGRSRLKVDYRDENGEPGSFSGAREHIPKRWRHLLTPDMLGPQLLL